jgi:hypothetical protein
MDGKGCLTQQLCALNTVASKFSYFIFYISISIH